MLTSFSRGCSKRKSVSKLYHMRNIHKKGIRVTVRRDKGWCGVDVGALCLSYMPARFPREDKHKAPTHPPLRPLSLRLSSLQGFQDGGNHAIQRALQFAHTAALWTRNILDHRWRDRETQRLGLRAQDSQSMLILRGLDICQQAPLKTRTQAVLQAMNGFGRAIARHHDLLIRAVQCIEGMEKFFLSRLLARDKLDIIH